jgi:hypothetical protein
LNRNAWYPEGVDAVGCQLDCQGNSVQLPTNFGDERRVRMAQLKSAQRARGALDKQLNRRKA